MYALPERSNIMQVIFFSSFNGFWYVCGMTIRKKIIKMFLGSDGKPKILQRERMTDHIFGSHGLTKREFSAYSPKLINEGILIQTPSTYTVDESAFNELKTKTFGEKAKEWKSKYWIIVGIFYVIIAFSGGILSPVFTDMVRKATQDETHDSTELNKSTIYVHDTIYIDSSRIQNK